MPGRAAAADAGKERVMKKAQIKKLALSRETVLRLERTPLRRVHGALVEIAPAEIPTSPLCVVTRCATGCDECTARD
jgi:hypothetical protein